MASREEIREGIAEEVSSNMLGKNYHELSVEEQEYLLFVAGQVAAKLHSQGVVLKVKCPDCAWSQFKDEVVGMTPCHSCNSTGSVYEPLEVKDGTSTSKSKE